MENPDCKSSEGVAAASEEHDGGGIAVPCSPQLFELGWNRALGPFRSKPFRDDNELVFEILKQEEALLKYADECRVSDEQMANLRRYTVAGGAEHDVFIIENEGRVWKATKENRWGFKKDSPLDYLRRLQALTTYTEPLEILIEGIAVRNGLPRIVTSMAYIHGRHPTPRQLHNKMLRDGCVLIPDETGLMAYMDAVKGLIFRDAHPGNFIIAGSTYVPIDVAIETAPASATSG